MTAALTSGSLYLVFDGQGTEPFHKSHGVMVSYADGSGSFIEGRNDNIDLSQTSNSNNIYWGPNTPAALAGAMGDPPLPTGLLDAKGGG